jgi:hypothetical protein
MQHRECFETIDMQEAEMFYFLQHAELIISMKENTFGAQYEWFSASHFCGFRKPLCLNF